MSPHGAALKYRRVLRSSGTADRLSVGKFDFPCRLNCSRRPWLRSTRRRRLMCRPDWCLLLRGRRSPLLRERSPRGPDRLASFPPTTLSLGRHRLAEVGQIASTEPLSTTPRAMRRAARAGSMSPGGPGAILRDTRRSLIIFSTRSIPLAGAGGSSIYTLRSVRLAICRFRGNEISTWRSYASSVGFSVPLALGVVHARKNPTTASASF